MASKHVIVCGGIKSVGVDTLGAVVLRLNLWGKGATANVSLHIEDIHAKLLRDVPEAFEDFAEIATYVYCADQAIGRGGKDVDTFGSHWRRDLEFHIPVRCLEFWRSKEVLAALCDTVTFLTDDFYSFAFYPAQDPPRFQQYLTMPIADGPKGDPEQVMMFSGGLDSLAGAIQEAVVEKKRVLLVNHRSTDKLNRKHAELLLKLEQKAGIFMPGHLRVRVNKDSGLTKDYHQRSRSLLYAALGGTVARLVGLKSLRFYENGVVGLNLPVCAQVVGSRATRTAHPRVLAGFQRILSLVAGERFEVSNPFQWSTRGEAIRKILDAGCGELVGPSMSCAHTWEISNEKTHCGMCSQCIDRRFGMIVANGEQYDPIGHYKGDVFTQSLPNDMDKMMVATFLERANSVKGITNEVQFISRFPEVLDSLPYLDGDASSALARVLDLYKRHAGEVNKGVDTMMGRHSRAIRERTLPGDCLLRIVYESASVTSVPADGAESGAGRQPAGAGERDAKIDAIHADLQQLMDITGPLPEAVAKVGAGVETVQQHVRGVPILQAELTEARVAPEAMALEIQNRIADILTPQQQEIWRAVRNAGGSQKDALPLLRKSGVVKSAPTLSRRVGEINAKLIKNGLRPCDASSPPSRYSKSGGYENDDGKTSPEELSPIERDWADDPNDRDTTIQEYLTASPENKVLFQQIKPGIEEESQKYLKRHPMKSG
ncbi:MAG: hypothetical protein NTV49_01610 [Kiritimatiellaeota bacterium]|nr:hypothetical protein [Kiritimatiellota bacterium]